MIGIDSCKSTIWSRPRRPLLLKEKFDEKKRIFETEYILFKDESTIIIKKGKYVYIYFREGKTKDCGRGIV